MTPTDPLTAARQAFAAGDRAAAEAALRTAAAANPNSFDALEMLGVILASTNRVTEAIPWLEKAAAIRPQEPAAWVNLGEALRREGRNADAVSRFRQALGLAPQFAEAWFNLGNALKTLSDWPGAESAFRRAIELDPRHIRAWYNLGNLLREDGRAPLSEDAYRRAIVIRPDWAEVWQNLAATLGDLSRPEEVVDCWRTVRRLVPTHPDADAGEASGLVQAGRIVEAEPLYRRVAAAKPADLAAQFKPWLLPEPIPAANEAIDEYRAKLESALADLADRRLSLNLADLHRSACEPPMMLTYQGRDNRRLKQKFAAVFASAMPAYDRPPAGTGIPHVGVVVTRGHEGVFDRCLGALLDEVISPEIRVSVVGQRGAITVLKHLRPGRKCGYLVVPDEIPETAAAIRAAGIDLLHYWEVGSDSFNYFLPFFRATAVQTATWGWPDTTGIAAIDAYVSCEWFEPDDADSHYSERLVRLPSLPTRYERPPVPAAPADPGEFGLTTGQRLYLCPQNLRKLHPDLDPAVTKLLELDDSAVFGVIADERSTITELFAKRLREGVSAPDRVRVFPRQPREQYLRLVTAATVLLDPPHYGAGANTFADALACGVPLIAWEGRHHRGRWTSGAYRSLGVEGLTATTGAEWATLSTRLATDNDHHRHAVESMRSAATRFFAPSSAAAELRDYFLEAITSARAMGDR